YTTLFRSANPAQISFTQEPLDFRRQCLSHCLSLLVPAFALPIPPGALTGLPSRAYGTLRYRSEDSRQTTTTSTVLCRLSTVLRPQSFGTWLEPRYIF